MLRRPLAPLASPPLMSAQFPVISHQTLPVPTLMGGGMNVHFTI